MSLVGTRPPTVDEWDKYELHHRARLATKPGLTGMWQVSGRSNITDLAHAFDFGNLKYVMAWCFSAVYFLGSGLYEKYRLRGSGKEYLLIFGGITFLFAITAVMQMINGFNSYAINEAVYYYTPLIFIIVYSQISKEQDVEMILNYLFVLYIIVFFKNFAGQLTLASIKSISFANSYSPFESEREFIMQQR